MRSFPTYLCCTIKSLRRISESGTCSGGGPGRALVYRHQWGMKVRLQRHVWHLHVPHFLLTDLLDSFSDVLLSLQVNYLQPHLGTDDPRGEVTYVHISLIFPPVLSAPPGS